MTQTVDFMVRRDKFSATETHTNDAAPLGDGEARIRVEKFALTANNITYAVFGEQMAYWNFFPAPDGFGRVPVWGYGVVEETNQSDLKVGERLYGYFPMSSHLTVQPGKVSAGGFTDMAAHRQPMSPVYNAYRRLDADPAHNPDTEAERMLFEPLFMTSFLIEGMFRESDWFGATRLLMTSASSKTSLALAQIAGQTSAETYRIGLTSPGNVDFVKKTGLYDEVRVYNDVSDLELEPSVYVDFAGNAGILHNIHERLGDDLKYACLVGATHWEASGGMKGAPGPEPILFFAPDHAHAKMKALGPDAFNAEIGKAWVSFLGQAKGLLEVTNLSGPDAVASAYLKVLKGEAGPNEGLILSLS